MESPKDRGLETRVGYDMVTGAKACGARAAVAMVLAHSLAAISPIEFFVVESKREMQHTRSK